MSDSDAGMGKKSSNENHDFADFADFSGDTALASTPGQENRLRGRQALEAHLATLEEQPAWRTIYDDLLAGRTADGGLVASRQIFESTWQRHLAQRAIAESLAPATG